MTTPPTRGARSAVLMHLARDIVRNEQELSETYSPERRAERLAAIGATEADLAPYIDAYETNPMWDTEDGRPTSTVEWEEEVMLLLNRERAAVERTSAALRELASDPATDWRALSVHLDIPEDALRARADKPLGSRLDATGVVSIAQAARLLHAPRSTVNHWVKTGRLKTTTSRGRTMAVLDAEGLPILTD